MASAARLKPLHDKPPVFLDRDGTIIVEKEYLSDPDQVYLEETVIEGLVRLQEMGHPLIVVSNQSGIGRGKFTEADAHRVNARVDELLRRDGIIILAWYFCPHAPDAICACRKPLPGMALAASSDWGVQLVGSYVIGDKKIDLELADAIGGTGILVTSGHGMEDTAWARADARPIFHYLREAAAYVCKCESDIAALGVRDKQSHATRCVKQ
jgi:D-glycero-D-manno-heptose 1,7-bisphosphate phosphatase